MGKAQMKLLEDPLVYRDLQAFEEPIANSLTKRDCRANVLRYDLDKRENWFIVEVIGEEVVVTIDSGVFAKKCKNKQAAKQVKSKMMSELKHKAANHMERILKKWVRN